MVTENRPNSRQRGYNRAWEKARAGYLASHPLCVMCLALGRSVGAQVVDHIVPHKGDSKLFWDKKNWQSLCKQHHNRDKQTLEKSGHVIGAGKDGVPIDPNHHWHK